MVSSPYHRPVPQCVVECDDPALPQQLQAQLVVAVVSLLVRINEGEVEGVLLSPGHQAAQSLRGGGDLQLYLVIHSGLGPELTGDICVLLTDVAGHNNTVCNTHSLFGASDVRPVQLKCDTVTI